VFAWLFLALSPRVGPAAGALAALPVVTAASDPAALVRCADEALYRVKARGKHGCAVYAEPRVTSAVA